MRRSWWLAAGLLAEGALAAMRLDMPHWVILMLAVAVPLALGKAADRVWRQLR